MTILLLLEHIIVESLTSLLISALRGSLSVGIVGLGNVQMEVRIIEF